MRLSSWFALALAGALLCLAALTCRAAENAPVAAKADEAKAPATPSLEDVMKDPNHKVGFVRKTVRHADGTDRPYYVWIPLTYSADKKWPVILFLHGAGECGTDGDKVLIQGLPKEIKKRGGKFDFIVVMPQCISLHPVPKDPAKGPTSEAGHKGGWRDAEEQLAIDAFKATLKEYSCDPDRLYLTGLSMGGYGTFMFALKYPNMFAATVPICGGGVVNRAGNIAHIPTWVWHGSDDKTVAPDNSRKMVAALVKEKAAEVRYTEVPGVGHNSWDNAYADDEVFKWLLEHKVSSLGKARPVKPVIDAPNWADAPK
jgi:predicted peptidase